MTRRRVVDPRTGRLYHVIRPARLTPPPAALRRATLDNLALVPGSLLPFKKQWIVLPSSKGPVRTTLEKVSSSMKAKGRRVIILSQDQLSAPLR